MDEELVVGLDAGGSGTRCAVATRGGTLIARSRAGGANPHSSTDPLAGIRDALRAAVEGIDPGRVLCGVCGVAGATATGEEATAAAVRELWSGLGLPGIPRVANDIAVAFAAGTPEPAGAVLIAGTGAVAARVRAESVLRRCDGYGWLFGDEGSAVWLAVAGLRAVLAAADGRGERTALRESLAAALGVPAGDAQRMLAAAYARAPAELGALAPAVSDAADREDPVARRIVTDAAQRLLAALAAVGPDESEPVVLAGGVLRSGPVAEAVRAGLCERFGSLVRVGGEGACGAAGLALRSIGAPPSAHAELLKEGRPRQEEAC